VYTKQLLLLDACVIINLEASNHFDTIAESLETQFWAVRQAATEVGSLRTEVDGVVQALPIRLDHHVTAGTLEIVDLKPDELALYVDLATELDDGEAASIAVALSRNMSIATDDRKARRVCTDRGLPEPVRTMDLIREYCEQESLPPERIRNILRQIRDQASFIPARSDPNGKWWTANIGV
jgi:predicted nucleic acid-binding protein